MIGRVIGSKCAMRGALSGLVGLVAVVAVPGVAVGHGIWAHIHVTGWAVENLEPGELRDFFSDEEVFNAALFGAAFTDSGYWPQGGPDHAAQRAYSEHTHWEPFIHDFVAWIRANDPPPWTSAASQQRVAFLMGCAAHGLQDEVFDSLFLEQVAEEDSGSQNNADPASDAFLVADGWRRFTPRRFIPMGTLLELYEVLDQDVTEALIDAAVNLMTTFYVNGDVGPELALSFLESSEAELPWTHNHYVDPGIPGSLAAEITPTMRYIEAIWERLHGRHDADDVVIHTYPELPRRLLGRKSGSPDSWITFIYGVGVAKGSADADLTEAAASGDSVPVQTKGTRWGAGYTRLHRVQPKNDLDPGVWYRAQLGAGLALIDGRQTSSPFELQFQAPCDDADDPACEDLGVIAAPSMDGPPPYVQPGPDASAGDATAAPGDGGGSDSGPDVPHGPLDVGAEPATADPQGPSSASGSDSEGCSGAPGQGGTPEVLWLVVLLLGGLSWRRRRVRGRRPQPFR